jgi:superfamily I DNA/RNA helicase
MIPLHEWHPVGGLELEPNALTAVCATGFNTVVAAGPGAGKTELLAQRADFLLRTGSCPYPRRILAISFKVDAARNLRDRVRLRSGRQYAARFDSYTFQAFAKRLIDNYRPALTGVNELRSNYRIDLDTRVQGEQITLADLVPLALEILADNGFARGALRQTYSHVFLDEFQDATRDQYELVRCAFLGTGALITAVGDVKQRIMAWAGALDGVMQKFSDDFEADSLPLYLNFRSAPRLRRMQNRMIRDMDPAAASPDEALSGDDGVIEVLHFGDEIDEATTVADLIEGWLADDVPPSDIAVLVRQQSREVTEALAEQLHDRSIPFRNEQASQDLAAEPIAALIFNFIRVVATERRPDAYLALLRVASRKATGDEAAQRFDSRLKQHLRDARTTVRSKSFTKGELDSWRPVVAAFLDLMSRPVLNTLSPDYLQGSRLDDLIEDALTAFGKELTVDGDPGEALKRLSELDAVRVLTIHKCKGLEFDKVVVLGVEENLFWGEAAMSEFFVAISRAKNHLVLTHANFRQHPSTPVKVWRPNRTAHTRFLAYAGPTTIS